MWRMGYGDADCHTSDIGHWFAMTEAERICVSFRDQSADWSWESVIPLHKSKGDADCHSQCAHWLRNDTLQVVR